MDILLERHNTILRKPLKRMMDTYSESTGDAFDAAFHNGHRGPLNRALEAQRRLSA